MKHLVATFILLTTAAYAQAVNQPRTTVGLSQIGAVTNEPCVLMVIPLVIPPSPLPHSPIPATLCIPLGPGIYLNTDLMKLMAVVPPLQKDIFMPSVPTKVFKTSRSAMEMPNVHINGVYQNNLWDFTWNASTGEITVTWNVPGWQGLTTGDVIILDYPYKTTP